MRERLRIRLPTPARRWTAREIKLLGTISDAEVTRRLRRKPSDVRRQRTSLKIPAFFQQQRGGYWKRAEIKLLGSLSDKDLAFQLGRSLRAVEAKRLSLSALGHKYDDVFIHLSG